MLLVDLAAAGLANLARAGLLTQLARAGVAKIHAEVHCTLVAEHLAAACGLDELGVDHASGGLVLGEVKVAVEHARDVTTFSGTGT